MCNSSTVCFMGPALKWPLLHSGKWSCGLSLGICVWAICIPVLVLLVNWSTFILDLTPKKFEFVHYLIRFFEPICRCGLYWLAANVLSVHLDYIYPSIGIASWLKYFYSEFLSKKCHLRTGWVGFLGPAVLVCKYGLYWLASNASAGLKDLLGSHESI